MTISFVESRYPKKLIGFLERVRNYKVEKTSPGIYTVKGDVIAAQIIDSRQLSDDENLWLKNLRGRLDNGAIIKVVSEINKQDKAVSLDAYVDVISRVNTGLIKETMEMRESLSLKEIIMSTETGAGWIKEWQSEAEAQGVAKGMAQGIAQGVAQGMAQGRVEGMAQGMAQGVAKGEAEGRAEALATVARNLKSSGMSCKLISQYTGLSLAKIRKL